MSVPVIAIDGPSGSGKGTISRALARHLGWHFLDSGVIYRAVAVAALDAGVEVADDAALEACARGLQVGFAEAADGDLSVQVNGRDVGARLRSEAVGEVASQAAAVPAVRAALLERQKAFRQAPGLVADGRDMGTVVFTDAPLKVFLTAGAEERAQRRHKQLSEKGIPANLAGLVRDIRARDARDAERSIAPLRPADDAVILDSTGVAIPAVVARILDLARQRGLVP